MSHQLHSPGSLADAYTTPNGLYGGPALQQALHASQLHSLQASGIDSYVMQGSNNHSPGLTPPHTHASGFPSYGGINSYPVGVADPYQRSYAYGM